MAHRTLSRPVTDGELWSNLHSITSALERAREGPASALTDFDRERLNALLEIFSGLTKIVQTENRLQPSDSPVGASAISFQHFLNDTVKEIFPGAEIGAVLADLISNIGKWLSDDNYIEGIDALDLAMRILTDLLLRIRAQRPPTPSHHALPI